MGDNRSCFELIPLLTSDVPVTTREFAIVVEVVKLPYDADTEPERTVDAVRDANDNV